MWTCKSSTIPILLVIFTIAQVRQVSADDPVTSGFETVTVKSCAIKFVNHSTYATSRPGIIADLPFEEGNTVQAGDLVVQLRDEVARANLRLREAQAQMRTPIDVAVKERKAAEIAFNSAVRANQESRNSFVQSEIERLELIYEARELQVKQAEEEFSLNAVAQEQAEAELESYLVHAKFGGLVTRVHKHVGEAVNLGDEIITIIDTNRVRVEGWLPYEQARRVQVGDPVRIQLDLSGISRDDADSSILSRVQNDDSDDEDPTPQRTLLPEEQQVFAGRIGFIGVTTGDNKGLLDDLRVWAEVENRDNILLEGLPAKMTVQVRPKLTLR